MKWTFGSTQSNDYVLSSYSAFDSNVGPIDAVDPTLQLVIGARYTVTVADPLDHPLQIIAKGATAFDDTLLLSQLYGDTSSYLDSTPLFETDPGVDFVNNQADKSIAFTLTQALADAMSDPTHGLVPGYRCGNPFHRGFQRGDLVLSSGSPAAKDPSDPVGGTIADATPIALNPSGGGLRPGTLAKPGEVDVYKFVAPVSGNLTITQGAAPGSALDSLVLAYDASGAMIGENGNGGGGLNSLLSFKVNAGNTYYVQASGYAGSTGAYNLGFTTDALGSALVGGTPDAELIALDDLGAADLTGQIAVAGARHDYQFNASISGTMTISERATKGSPLDSLLTVYNSSGVVIAADDDGGGGLDSLVAIPVVAGQAYRVRAAGLGLSQGDYALSVSTADVGNTIQDAGTVGLSASGSGSQQGHIGLGEEEDLYRVQIPASGTMTALLLSDFNGTLTILDASGNEIDDFDNIGSAGRVDFAVSQGETIYARVSAFGDETGVFTLSLSVDNSPHTFAGAPLIPLTSLGFASQAGEIGLPGAADMYAFVAPTSGLVVVSMDAIDGTAIDSNITVYDARQAPLAGDDDYGGSLNSRLELPVRAGQLYYVRAAATGNTIGRYNLTLSVAKTRAELATPTPIAVDASGSGRASGVVSVPGEVETYRFVAPADGTIGIRVDAQPGGHFDGPWAVFDASGREVATDDIGDGRYDGAAMTPVLAGRAYTIRVSGFESSTGPFDLILGDDYGNDPAHAYPISLDDKGRASISGQVNPSGDVDVFRLVAPASGPLTVVLTQPPPSDLINPTPLAVPIALLSVVDASGAVVTSDNRLVTVMATDGSGNNVVFDRLNFEMVAGRVYYIEVTGQGQETGSYQLGLDAEAGASGSDAARQVITPNPLTGQADVTGEVALAGDVQKFLYTSPVAGVLVITQSAAPGSFLQGSLNLPVGEAKQSYDDATLPFFKGYSRVQFNVAQGQKVAIDVGGTFASTGRFLLDLRVLPYSNQNIITTQLVPTNPFDFVPTAVYAAPDDLAVSLIGPNNPTIQLVPGSVRYQGTTNASGLFVGGTGLLDSRGNGGSPFESGVILTNGDASLVPGPNIEDARSGVNNVPGDPDLDRLVQGRTTDASALSFRFIPKTNIVQLRYVFSSEEYDKFVGSPFNDAFGIFINGVDYARVPGTGSPAIGTGDIVSVNSINDHTNSRYFIDNTFTAAGGYGHLNIAINGLTTVLTLTAPVLPEQVNSIKLAIADTVDPNYDSAAFIQANSFQSVTESIPSDSVVGQHLGQLVQSAPDIRAANPALTQAQVNFLFNKAIVNSSIKNLGLSGENLGLYGDYLIIPVDPIDFTLTGPGGLKVTSNSGNMNVSGVQNAFFAGSGSNELLILPNASRGEYRVDLVGLGSGDFLFGASFVTASKDVTTDLVQGNLQGSHAFAVLDFQTLGGGVQVRPDLVSSAASQGGGPGGSPSPSPSPDTPPVMVDSNSLSGPGALATTINGVLVALSVQISGSPNATATSTAVVAGSAAQGVSAASPASPTQPAPAKDFAGQGILPREAETPGEEDPEREKPNELGSALLGWMGRILGESVGARPGIQVMRALIGKVLSWLKFPAASGPRSSIEGPTPDGILRPAHGQVGPAADDVLDRRPEAMANVPEPDRIGATAEDLPASASFTLLVTSISPLTLIHRRDGGKSGQIRRRNGPGSGPETV